MKYLPILILAFACSSPNKPAPVANKTTILLHSTDSLLSSVQKSQDRLYYVISIVGKRDSLLVKKYENEVLYYQTGNDKYRKRCNRLIDSVNKYVRIIDSLAKQLKQ